MLTTAILERPVDAQEEELYVSRIFVDGFTAGIEGPAADMAGNVYAVNYQHQGTIGKVTPNGEASIFVELSDDSVGNGIRFDSHGDMFIADYINHNVLKVNMATRQVSVHAHESAMNLPNDLAIGANDMLYASDLNWTTLQGSIWRIDPNGIVTLLDGNMGTANGIEVGIDERTLYVNESAQKKVWAYDLSPLGEISNKRLLIQFSSFQMDGMRCDVEGNLYIARYGKGTVAKVSPSGEVLLEVELLGENPSNITFGGPDGRTCYVTLADQGTLETFRVEQPGRSWRLMHPPSTEVAPVSWGAVKERAALK